MNAALATETAACNLLPVAFNATATLEVGTEYRLGGPEGVLCVAGEDLPVAIVDGVDGFVVCETATGERLFVRDEETVVETN